MGASHPNEMVAMAAELGYSAIAITDECSLAGGVRAHEEAKRRQLHLIVGAELCCDDGLTVVALAQSRMGYGRLSRLITARRAAPKGSYLLRREDLCELEVCLLLWIPNHEIEKNRAVIEKLLRQGFLRLDPWPRISEHGLAMYARHPEQDG